MTRRDLLLGAGAATLAPNLPALAPDWQAKARRNLRLGVFTHIYSRLPVAEAARRIRADGFHSAVLEHQFADVRFDPLAPDWSAASKITAAFEKAQVRIAALAAYYNIVDPDLARRKHGEQRIRSLLTNWKRLGSPIVCTETGTLNEKSEWVESPDNYTDAAYMQCRDILAELAQHAHSAGATLAIEPYWRNLVDSAARAERLFKDVASPALQLVMDPVQLLPRCRPAEHGADARGHLPPRGLAHRLLRTPRTSNRLPADRTCPPRDWARWTTPSSSACWRGSISRST